jgi:hypothetical protein
MTTDVLVNTQNVRGQSTAGAVGGDLLWSVKAIAAEIGRTER